MDISKMLQDRAEEMPQMRRTIRKTIDAAIRAFNPRYRVVIARIDSDMKNP